MDRRALVIGYGSIGMRHARILRELGMSVSVVSRRSDVSREMPSYPAVAQAIEVARPDYVVVATETAAHADGLNALAKTGWVGPVLVEKPLFAVASDARTPPAGDIRVGYQLRFHPLVERLRALTAGGRIVSAQFYVGQHLDTWRPGRAAQQSYSGHAGQGGGVLRDLSHELDLALWLFGPCRRVAALGGRLSDVTADSDDTWGILAEFERCPVASIQLNYLDRISQRRIVVVTTERTVAADLVANTLTVDGWTEAVPCERDEPYIAMHRAVLAGAGEVCDYDGGMRVMALIEAVERAAMTGAWVRP